MAFYTNGSVYYTGFRDGVSFFKPFDYASVGTVDLQTVEYVEEPREDLTCSICYGQFVDPIITQCGHTFCRSCLRTLFTTIQDKYQCPCPMCRSTISNEFPVRKSSPAVAKTVDRLLVACPQKFRGCTAQLPRSQVQAHCRYRCAFKHQKDPRSQNIQKTQTPSGKVIVFKTPAFEIHQRIRARSSIWRD